MHIVKLDDLVNKYNKMYYSITKMKPIDVTSSTWLDFNKENNEKDPKFRVGYYVRILKFKNIFGKGYFPN